MYRIEPMRTDDVIEVGRVERRCFANPWPASAYRRELQAANQNYYIVLRHYADDDAPGPGAGAGVGADPAGTRVVPRRGLLPLALTRKLGLSPELSSAVGQIIGFAGMWVSFDEAHVTTIGVDPVHRGHGLGELLLIAMFDEAFRRHLNWLTLEVRVSNDAAQTLYRKYGMTEQGRRKRYYSDNNEDALIMWSEALSDPPNQAMIEDHRERLLARLAVTPAEVGLLGPDATPDESTG